MFELFILIVSMESREHVYLNEISMFIKKGILKKHKGFFSRLFFQHETVDSDHVFGEHNFYFLDNKYSMLFVSLFPQKNLEAHYAYDTESKYLSLYFSVCHTVHCNRSLFRE